MESEAGTVWGVATGTKLVLTLFGRMFAASGASFCFCVSFCQ
jgi:hypothetical protein